MCTDFPWVAPRLPECSMFLCFIFLYIHTNCPYCGPHSSKRLAFPVCLPINQRAHTIRSLRVASSLTLLIELIWPRGNRQWASEFVIDIGSFPASVVLWKIPFCRFIYWDILLKKEESSFKNMKLFEDPSTKHYLVGILKSFSIRKWRCN